MNLSIYLTFYVLILISIIGYGLLLQNILKNVVNIEFEYNLLGSLLFLICLSFFTHFFFNHGYTHNIVILLTGVILFISNFLKEKKKNYKYLRYIFFLFGILIIGLLTHKTHDDFPYYHFPYTYYLTQENLVIGAGQLVHAFRTPSSIFYLNSLFYLPIIEYFLFNMAAILIFGFSNLILIFKLKNDLKSKRYDFIFYLTLLSFLFVNIFFYRISEHGTDRSAQILILILFIEVLSLYRSSINIEKHFSKIFILLGLIVTLKAFYVLYLLILIPILFELKKSRLFYNFFKNFYFYIFCFVGFFLILVNVFNSGCVIYPVRITCFTNLEWSLFNEAKSSNDWSGFYLGVYHSEDKLSASATSNTWPDDPYDISTDKDKNNFGYFLGYNYVIKDAIIGFETSYQDNVGRDETITNLIGWGWAVYDDMVEYKLKLGYSFGKNLIYGFYGTGDLNVYWSDFTNEKTSTHDYEIKGIGISRKITNNTFIGLSISETDLFLYYPDTDYDEKVQLDSLRLRFGYLF